MTSTNQIPYGANTLRLNANEWAIVALIVIVSLNALPTIWKNIEPFEPSDDYRIPFALSNDYWIYQRLSEWTADEDRILAIGDSVVWGEYVRPDQTLTHYLNERTGKSRFVNGGVAGTHPLALEGLVRHYARDIRNTRVMLHLNLLWMSAPERDLSKPSKEIAFNHPQLIPQFSPSIPAYPASISDRLGVVVDRNLPIRRWVHHMRVAWFESLDIHTWSIEHPYDNPLAAIDVHLPKPNRRSRHGAKSMSWKERGIKSQSMNWVSLEESLQWAAFLRTVNLLNERGNRVFVAIGPFNAHMLNQNNHVKYNGLLRDAIDELAKRNIPHFAVPLLAGDQFADASHPLPEGYASAARSIHALPEFRLWINEK